MQPEIFGVVTVLICMMIASLSIQWHRARQSTRDLEVLQRGVLTHGKVVAISRPIGRLNQIEIYFSYEVPDRGQMLHSCSLDVLALRQQHGVAMADRGRCSGRPRPAAEPHARGDTAAPALPRRFQTRAAPQSSAL